MTTWLPTWSAGPERWRAADHPLPSPVAEHTRVRAARFRLARVRGQLTAPACPAILLYDPVNIMYALDVSNMNVWMLHNSSHYRARVRRRPHLRLRL